MSVIRKARVEIFRSLRRAQVDNLDAHVSVIGMNGTDKGSPLKALSLVFDEPVDLDKAWFTPRRGFPRRAQPPAAHPFVSTTGETGSRVTL